MAGNSFTEQEYNYTPSKFSLCAGRLYLVIGHSNIETAVGPGLSQFIIFLDIYYMHTNLTKAEDSPRMALRKVKQILDETPNLKARFLKARKIIRNFRRPAFYEISQKCGLFCEGCYYFEDTDRQHINNEMTPKEWELFLNMKSNAE